MLVGRFWVLFLIVPKLCLWKYIKRKSASPNKDYKIIIIIHFLNVKIKLLLIKILSKQLKYLRKTRMEL